MVPGSIAGDVTGFFSDIFPSDQTMALGSTQPLVKMNTRNIPGGKSGRCLRLTTYHHTVPLSRNLGTLTLLDPSGPAWPVTGVLYIYISPFVFFYCGLFYLLIVGVDGYCCTWAHSVGIPWTRDQPVAKTSTWQYTTFARDSHSTAGFEPAVAGSEQLQTWDSPATKFTRHFNFR